MCNIKNILRVSLIFTLVLMAFTSCTKKSDGGNPEPKQEAVPEGALMDQTIRFQYAIYYLPSPAKKPDSVLREILSKEKAPPALTDKIPDKAGKPVVSGRTLTDVQSQYAPPDLQSLQYFGRGLTREQGERLQESREVYVMDFAHDKTHVWEALRMANGIAVVLARETGGLLWDEQTREVFTPEAWEETRIQSWTGNVPDISKQITIHAYNSDEFVRAITLGMSKFGLPDVVAENFSWSYNRTMGHLINLFCQSIAEGHLQHRGGEYDLDIKKIENKDVREPMISSLKTNATAVALLTLNKGKWEKGDPENRLIELGFDRYDGHDVHAKQEKLLSNLFGWEDRITQVKHNEELLAASQRARDKLSVLREEFVNGLNPGEFIQVKAPFKTPDGGRKFMWVEITDWDGDGIKGLLQNEPYNIPTLHGGQMVEVNQQDVFDYIRKFPDGSQEGNETGAIIQKMQQSSSEK